jgi:hypothetical protein
MDFGNYYWLDPAIAVSYTPTVWMNRSGAEVDGVPDGAMSMHPGQRGEIAVLRFTAPAAGTYAAMVELSEGDRGAIHAAVDVGGWRLFSGTVTSSEVVSIPGTALVAGHAIELRVGASSDGAEYDNTPVHFTVLLE